MGGVTKKTLYTGGMTVFTLALNVCLGRLLGQELAAELLQFALYPVSLLLFSRSRLPRCLLAGGVTLVIMFLTDQAFSMIFTAMGGSILADGMPSMFQNPGLFAFIRVLLIVELAFIAYVVDRLWSILVDKTDDGTLWYFMLFPLSQGLLIYWSGSLAIQKGGEMQDFLLTSLLALLCVAADFVMFRVMDESGANLDYRAIDSYYDYPRVQGLAEMMNSYGVIHNDAEVVSKIVASQAHHKKIDGHAPGLQGKDLDTYVAAGVYSDHECSTVEDALAKLERGQFIMIREGTAARNLEALAPLLTPQYAERCMSPHLVINRIREISAKNLCCISVPPSAPKLFSF